MQSIIYNYVNELQTSKFVSNKGEIIVLLQSWLCSNDFYSNDFTLISVFGFVHLTVAVILVSLQLYGRKYLSFKTANAYAFSRQSQTINPMHNPQLATVKTAPYAWYLYFVTNISHCYTLLVIKSDSHPLQKFVLFASMKAF